MNTPLSLQLRRALVATALFAATPLFAQTDPKPFPAGETPEDANNHLPRLLSRVAPAYPTDLANRGLKGDVYVAFVVDRTGKPMRVRAFFSPNDALEQPAVDAVKQWTFEPGLHLGRLVNTQMVVCVHVAPASATQASASP